MKPALQAGLRHELSFEVPEGKTVPALYPESAEFRAMPKVLATGYLVGLLEWACIRAIAPYLDAGEQTVGTHINVSHCAATPPGLTVKAAARLIQVDGRRLLFDVEAHDGAEVISRGVHERFVVRRTRFDEKVAAKAGFICNAAPDA